MMMIIIIIIIIKFKNQLVCKIVFRNWIDPIILYETTDGKVFLRFLYNMSSDKWINLFPPISQAKTFNDLIIPVDGEWSEWGAWSPCTGSCGAATRTRTRSCDDPPPTSKGKFCVGRSNQTMACSPAGGQCEDTGELSDIDLTLKHNHHIN